MRVLTWNLTLGTWLIVSCFVLEQTPQSIILAYATAVVVLAASIAALAQPGARHVVAVAAVLLAIAAVLLPELSWAARVSDVVTAAVLFRLSRLPPARARWEGEEEAPLTPHPHEHTARAG